jgi:hypothetical protein
LITQIYLRLLGKTKSLCEDDTITIDKMSNKDSLFVKYLNSKLGNKLAFTAQDKCLNLLGNDYINKKNGRAQCLSKRPI